jgi:hypothetical protein
MQEKVAVLIKTCQGRPSLLWVLKSIEYALHDEHYRIYISDEKPLDDWKKDVYEKLNDQGHHIELHDRGIACGIARNRLVEKLQDEELVLRMDDDFELGGEFNFNALKSVLRISDEIGFCSDYERQLGHNKGVRSGSIRPAGGEFVISPPKLIKKFHSPFRKLRKFSGTRYSLAEHTRNLLLLKRDVIEKVKWSEQLLFRGEHEEFLLSILDTGYKGAYTPDSIHYHRADLPILSNSKEGMINNKRPGKEEFKKVLTERWNCKEVKTKYPISWYCLEGMRRMLSNITYYV